MVEEMFTKEKVYEQLHKRLTPEEVYILCATLMEQFYDDEIIEKILSGDFDKW